MVEVYRKRITENGKVVPEKVGAYTKDTKKGFMPNTDDVRSDEAVANLAELNALFTKRSLITEN